MYKVNFLRIFLYHIFIYNSFLATIEISSNLFLIEIYNQNEIKELMGENIYSLCKTNTSNLNFTGNIFVIGNEKYLTEIFFNNLPLQTGPVENYLMINPYTMQVYSGKNSSPTPPVPDIVTIPNLITNQINAINNDLYINNIDSNTIIGNNSGNITITTEKFIADGVITSDSLFLHFSCPISFENNIEDVTEIGGEILFCTNGIDKIHTKKIFITDTVNTSKNNVFLGDANNLIEINFDNTCTIDSNINTTLGEINSPIVIQNIPFFNLLNDKNVSYLTCDNQTQKISQIKPIAQNIYQSSMKPSQQFYLDSINGKDIKFLSMYCPSKEETLYFGGFIINIETINTISDFTLQDWRRGSSYIEIMIKNGTIDNFLLNRKLSIIGYKIPLIINNIQSEGKIYFDTKVSINGLTQMIQSEIGAIGYNTGTKTLTAINSGYKSKEYDNYLIEKSSLKKDQDTIQHQKIDGKINRLEEIYQKLLYIKNQIGKKNEK